LIACDTFHILSLIPAKRFHSCVVTTYSFDFNYFSHEWLAVLGRTGVRNICVLLDENMLQQYLGTISGYASAAAKRYSIASIKRNGAFHPKMMLFFGREGHGFLVIGSGNLTAAGHGGNEELWGAFNIYGPRDPKAALFKQAWEYVKLLGKESPGISQRKLEWIEEQTSWLNDIDVSRQATGWYDIGRGVEAYFLNNSGAGILSDLTEIVREPVLECNIISPFFDKKAAALLELEKIYSDSKINVIIQPDTVVADFDTNQFKQVQFYDWNSIISGKSKRYLHAKLLHLLTESAEYCMIGSANLTAPALGTPEIKPSNEEACLLLKKKEGKWLEGLGLDIKGKPIQIEEISKNKLIQVEHLHVQKAHEFRLLAADHIGGCIQIYIEPEPDLQTATIAIYDGWGETCKSFKLEDAEWIPDSKLMRIHAGNIPDAALYCQIINAAGVKISNKQIIHDIIALSRTNPDQISTKMQEILSRIEFEDAEIFEILAYLDPDDLMNRDTSLGGTSNIYNYEGKNKNDGTGEKLSYDDFTKTAPEHKYKGIGSNYGTHRISSILEALNSIFVKLMIKDISINEQDEESDKDALDVSTGRYDEEFISNHEYPPQKRSAFNALRKKIFRFFNQYISILDKQLDRQRKNEKPFHKVNVLDASMFTIALHLLIDFLNKPIRIKDRDKEHEDSIDLLFESGGDYFDKNDYCRIATEIIGKYTLLLINGIDDSNDEYVRQRIAVCRQWAFWHAICCIVRLDPSNCKVLFFKLF